MTPPSPSSLRARAEELPRFVIEGRYGGLIRAVPHPSGEWVRWDDVVALLTDARVPAGEGEAERPDYWQQVERIKQAHAETLKVFAEIGGETSPRQAAKYAADYMLEVLFAALRESSPAAPPEPQTQTGSGNPPHGVYPHGCRPAPEPEAGLSGSDCGNPKCEECYPQDDTADDIARLEHQVNTDHHPSDTVVVSRSVLKRVLRAARGGERK